MIKNPKELKFLIWLSRYPGKHIPQEYSNLEWAVIIEYAERNRLIPFFFHIISCSSCQKKVPEKWLKILKSSSYGALLTHAIQEREKIKISRKLTRQKIRTVPLKDIEGYNIRHPRHLFPQKLDIDLFIPNPTRKKIEAIKTLMSCLKYDYHEIGIPENQLTKFDRLALNYIKEVNSVPVAIDFHLEKILPEGKGKANPINESINEKFTKKFISSIHQAKGKHYHLASMELHLLFWCWHFFFRDNCQGLRTLFDLAQICKQDNLDWSKVLKVANQFGLSSYFLFTIAIAHQVFKFKLSKRIITEVRENKRVNTALKLYSPLLTAYVESIEEKMDKRLNRELRKYFFLIKLVLWKKPVIFKVGPRVAFYSFYYLPIVYLRLKRLERSF